MEFANPHNYRYGLMISTPESSAIKGKESNKFVRGGAWQKRRAFYEERDGLVTGWVNEWEVFDRRLTCANLGWENTVSNLKMAEKLLRRLAHRGDFQQREQDNVVFSITNDINLRSEKERNQLRHKYQGAVRGSTFIRAVEIDERISGSVLRARKLKGEYLVPLIPDEFCRVGRFGYCFEDETGKNKWRDVVEKCALYPTLLDALKMHFKVSHITVFWNCQLASWVPRIAQIIREQQLPAGVQTPSSLFFINHAASIDPFDSDSILKPIYLSPSDNKYYPLG